MGQLVKLPIAENRKVRRNTPKRGTNGERRSREYLTPEEVERMMAAASRQGRYGHRDATMILIAYRHGLRAGELVALRRDAYDLKGGTLHIFRLKNGSPSVHPLRGPELRALRKLQREQGPSAYVFQSERGGPMTTDAFLKIVARAGAAAKIGFPVHPHMLRHATGYYLANKGIDTRAIQQYLGHRNIQHTVRYTELAHGRFKDFWKD
jgi:type 1 fimbriae regulatory protein FimB/type 1 fimbriae regulatory protein FimE